MVGMIYSGTKYFFPEFGLEISKVVLTRNWTW
jgi:hypothetical protein